MESNHIWSFWDGPENKTVTKCELTWEKYLSESETKTISLADISEYDLILPKRFSDLNVQLKSDIVRLNLMYKYGGVWLDKTIKLNNNMEWLYKFIEKNGKDHYYMPKLRFKNYPECWLIACPLPGNPNILKILNLMIEMSEYYPDHDKTFVYKDCECNYSRNRERGYFLIYQVFCYLDKNDPEFKWPIILPFNADLALSPYIDNPFLKVKKYTSAGEDDKSLIVNLTLIVLLSVCILWLIYKFRIKRL